MGRKRVKLEEEKVDRIGDLPDEIIHHILSFLPSTKEAIQTSILSKRWRKQWTHVPVLIFNPITGMSFFKFFEFTRDTLLLHECSKIKKFHLKYSFHNGKDPQLSAIRYATEKDVEDLCLINSDDWIIYMLPEFLYNNTSLVKLRTQSYSFTPNGKVNWGSLTALSMEGCELNDRAIEHILSGSPLLESFELIKCRRFDKLVIASKSMKRLVLQSPKKDSYTTSRISVIQISCPKLEKFKIGGYCNAATFELLNSPSSLCATIDFMNYNPTCKEIIGSFIKDILHQLHHVKELTIGSFIVESLPFLVKGDRFSQVLNIKCLTLYDPDPLLYDHHTNYNDSGIICLLRNSPVLEKLVINFPLDYKDRRGRPEYDWNSNHNNVLVPHLKTIKIIGFPRRSNDKYKYTCCRRVLSFIQFLLNNARALEKMIIEVEGHDQTAFQSRLSKKLSHLTRSSQHAIIEVLCSNKYRG